MTWKLVVTLAALGMLTAVDGRSMLGLRPEAGSTLTAELTGTSIAGRMPVGSVVFDRGLDSLESFLEVEDLELPQGTRLDSWLNPSANAPCEGVALGSASLDPAGSAAWDIDPGVALLSETVEGGFISVCTGGDPLVSGNLQLQS